MMPTYRTIRSSIFLCTRIERSIFRQLLGFIALATGCRIGALVMARWAHVDLEKATWFVPRENTTKTNVDWQVYLSDFALRQRGLRRLLIERPVHLGMDAR